MSELCPREGPRACQPKYTHCRSVNTAPMSVGPQMHLYSTGCRLVCQMLQYGHEIQLSPPVATYSSGFLVRLFIGAGRNSCGDRHQSIDASQNRNRTGPLLHGRPLRPGCCSFSLWHSGDAGRREAAQSEPARRDLSRKFTRMASFCRRVNQAISSHQSASAVAGIEVSIFRNGSGSPSVFTDCHGRDFPVQ